MKCLSIRQPWAWLIVHAGKDIENRTWPTRYRGPVAIHAATWMTNAGVYACGRFVADIDPNILCEMPLHWQLDRGGIVGVAEIVDCVTASDSPWFAGPYGFVLRDARPVAFVPMRGRLGLFDVPDEVAQTTEG